MISGTRDDFICKLFDAHKNNDYAVVGQRPSVSEHYVFNSVCPFAVDKNPASSSLSPLWRPRTHLFPIPPRRLK